MAKFIILLSIYYHAIMHGIQPEVAVAQVFVESSFRPQAVNGKCIGLMQVNVPVWRKQLNLDPKRMTEVWYNLDAGMTILRHYLDKSNGDIIRALWLYNAGYKYDATKYIRKVRMAYRQIFRREL
jgi:soluble lytic murein transglycosylase-like protein